MARVSSLWSDARYAARALRRRPAFSFTAVVVLGLGIGAATTVFATLRAVLLRPLPYETPSDLVRVGYGPSSDDTGFVPSPVLKEWIDRSVTLQSFAWYTTAQVTALKSDGEPVSLVAAFVSPNFFALVGKSAVHYGREFSTSDRLGTTDVVMLTPPFAESFFGGKEPAIGRSFNINTRSMSVIGLTAPSFRFPSFVQPDVFVELDPFRDVAAVYSVKVIARLRAGRSIPEATSELRGIDRSAASNYPRAMVALQRAGAAPTVVDLRRAIAGSSRTPLVAAFAAVLLLFLLACTNYAGLLLARTAGRQRELAVRAALGAGRQQLTQLVLVESVLTAIVSAVLALGFLGSCTVILQRGLAGAVPNAQDIGIDAAVLCFVAVCSLVSGLVAGLSVYFAVSAPSFLTLSQHLSSHTYRLKRFRESLIAGQVTLAVTLLISTLLLFDTVWTLTGVDLGFESSHLMTAKVSALKFGTSPAGRALKVTEIIDRVASLPGVVSCGASNVLPLGGHAFRFSVVSSDPQARPSPDVAVDLVSPGYFRTVGVRLLAGRDFAAGDIEDGHPVAIVNKAFASLVGNEGVIGVRLSLGGSAKDADIRVVGVVNDFKDENPGESPQPTIYRPFSQAWPQIGWHTMALAVRTAKEGAVTATVLKSLVSTEAPGSAVYDVRTMEDRIANVTAAPRLRATVFGAFAATALAIAAIGIYGLLAWMATQRGPELGVRIALGATRRQTFALILMSGAGPTAIGIVGGWFMSIWTARFLRGELYGVSPFHAQTYLLAAATMLATSIAASFVPAYRAAGTDPLSILRLDQ